MTSPRELLREAGVRPRKKWGQNFLVHTASAEKIVRWAEVHEADVVLEIGPGLGALTEALRGHCSEIIAIERDAKLVSSLRKRWPDTDWLQLIQADLLDVDLKALSQESDSSLIVVSNLPYSVSTPILEHLMLAKSVINKMTLLLQEEVVQRLCADIGTKEYGRMTIWARAGWEVEAGPKIPPGSFFPAPEVDSRLVRFTPRTVPLVPDHELEPFLSLVKALFQQRRKMIRRSLKNIHPDGKQIEQILKKLEIEPERRPETFSIEELLQLTRAFQATD